MAPPAAAAMTPRISSACFVPASAAALIRIVSPGHWDASAFHHHHQENRSVAIVGNELLRCVAIEEAHSHCLPQPTYPWNARRSARKSRDPAVDQPVNPQLVPPSDSSASRSQPDGFCADGAPMNPPQVEPGCLRRSTSPTAHYKPSACEGGASKLVTGSKISSETRPKACSPSSRR
jgi:hypothetical protein